MDWGNQLDFLNALADQSGIIPQALTDKPDVFEDLEPVLRAFGVLSASRPLHAGPTLAVAGPIPLTEIQAYCALFDMRETEDFIHLIRAMDDAYLTRVAERRRERSTQGSP